jgi:branched-chain amino acid transport system substrate-binding protein
MVSTVGRSRWSVLGCVAAALLLGACSSSATTSAPGSAKSSSGPPLVIGASMSLSGDFANLADPAKKGYELWAATVNAKGGLLGRKVSLKIVDDASNPTQVVTNYQNLITSDHVNLVFGPFSSLLTVPSATVASRFGYAFIEPSGGAPQVFALHLHDLFLAQPAPIVSSGDAFANYILSLPASQRPKTAAYPAADDPFTLAIVDEIQHRLQAAGIKTVYTTIYAPETVDLSPVVTRLVAAKADLLVSGTGGADAVAEVKGMVQAHWTPKVVFFTGGPNDPTFPAQVGSANAEGIFSTGDWFPEAKTFGNAAFVKAYVAKYGGTTAKVDPAAAEAYACGQLLEEVAAKYGKIDNATIISALHNGTWPTVEGNLSWDAYGAPKGSDTVVQWVHGQLMPVYPPASAVAQPVAKPAWAG